MKILVTGATGYIGGSVAAKLMAAGHKVVGLTRSDDGAAKLKTLGIEPLVGSLISLDLLAEAAEVFAELVEHSSMADDAALAILAGLDAQRVQREMAAFDVFAHCIFPFIASASRSAGVMLRGVRYSSRPSAR